LTVEERGEGDAAIETGREEIVDEEGPRRELDEVALLVVEKGNGLGRWREVDRVVAGEKEGEAGAELVLATGAGACRG
jgi:hypothetical protein